MANHHNALVYRSKKRSAFDQGEKYGFVKKFKASTPEKQDDDGGLKGFVKAQSVHSDSSSEWEGCSERSDDTVIAEERDDSVGEEEFVESQYGEFEFEPREWYNGKGYKGNDGFKAKKVAEFQETTKERLEDWLEGDLCPREENTDGYKEEMKWALKLLDRLVDLVHYVKNKQEYNRLLKEQRSKRRGKGGLPQIREKEVNLVLQREIKKAKKAKQAAMRDSK